MNTIITGAKSIILLLTLTLSVFNASAQNTCATPDEIQQPLTKTLNYVIPKDTVVKVMKKTMIAAGIKTGDTIWLAIEVDSLLRSKFTDSASCYKYVTKLVHGIDSLYKTELNVNVGISYFAIRKKKNFYNQDNNATNSTVCDSFRRYWNSKYKNIKRSTAQLLTWSMYGGGGYGLTSGLNNSSGYSVCGISANNDFSLTSYDIYIMSHELGHICGASHTHSCAYGIAVDSCVTGCFTGATKTSKGSIMSYCLKPGPLSPNLSYLLGRDYQVGISEDEHNSSNFANIIPNGSGKFKVTSSRSVSTLRIIDLKGRTLNTLTNPGSDFSFDLPSTCIYILELSSGDYTQRVKVSAY